ncbi:hypothetical protein ALC62_00684 [Cyphomyrmex costatus]|uniref:Uncharacterized protein n=1 Tax=Cyphomyrmex costatus TaxID=456900 RepID=A0A151IQR5_9HYME|nr:hypothetical protein ALC62_00684 [Cyphomyrmex costatus]
MAEEELLVTLCRGDSGSGGSFGFSLLGASASAGLPAAHVIYDIVENSPAARSGKESFPAVRTIFAYLTYRKLILTYQRFSHDRFLRVARYVFTNETMIFLRVFSLA